MLKCFDRLKIDADFFSAHLATSAGIIEFADMVLKVGADATTRLSGEVYPTFVQVPLLDPRLIDMGYLNDDNENCRAQNCLIDAMIAHEELRTRNVARHLQHQLLPPTQCFSHRHDPRDQ
jgi:hypothetical protein